MEWSIALFLVVGLGFWYIHGILTKIYVLLCDWHYEWSKKNDPESFLDNED